MKGNIMNRITEITRRDILDLFRNGLVIGEFFETKNNYILLLGTTY